LLCENGAFPCAALASGKGILKTARECGTGVSVVQRIKADMARDK
jgi:hypothetical protein